MKKRISIPAVIAVLLVLAATAWADDKKADDKKSEEKVLTGPVTQEHMEAAAPDWVYAKAESRVDDAAVQGLAQVEPGAEVTVFLGTWCDDSRREVPRLWNVLELAGKSVPFQVRYIAVDRDKKDPEGQAEKSGIRYVPTFIVVRGGREVGRIVESSPNGVESDLLALLTGKAQGVISTRKDLGAGGSSR
jgi:thiol-disulfide isomerase/thioredoxin